MRAARTNRSASKQKKSYTLSRSSVEFLERLHKKRSAPSVSAILDGLIRDAEAQQKREDVERAFKEYYDNLTGDEERELREWGVYAMGVLRRVRK